MADDSTTISQLLAQLDEEERQFFLDRIDEIHLLPGESLFAQGDRSDCLYLLMKGHLLAYLQSAESSQKVIGDIHPGETVGEVGLLSGRKRSLTIRARTEAHLYKITEETWQLFSERYPRTTLNLVRSIMHRLSKTLTLLKSHDCTNQTLLLPANPRSDWPQIKSCLKQQTIIQKHSKLVDVDEYLAKLSSKVLETDFVAWIDMLASGHEHLLLLYSGTDPNINELLLNSVGRVIILGTSKQTPQYHAHIEALFRSARCYYNIRFELLLDRHNNFQTWFSSHDYKDYRIIDFHNPSNQARLIRYCHGVETGLVLSGGGARGWIHLGVCQALMEQQIAIDAIGGTSIGAIAAAFYCLAKDPKALQQFGLTLAEASRKTLSPLAMCLPIVSLLNGAAVSNYFQEQFHSHMIESLNLPYFAVSSDLNHQQAQFFTHGPLTQAIRASSAIPGILPPVTTNGIILSDGGLINNFPVDFMRQRVGQRGRIIGINIGSSTLGDRHFHFPTSITLWDSVKYHLGFKPKEINYPRFLEFFMNALLVGSQPLAQANNKLCDLLITPNLSSVKVSMTKTRQHQALIELGHREISAVMHEIKQWY